MNETRRVYIDDIVTLQQAAQRLGITRQAVYAQRANHSDFPEPIAQAGQVTLYDFQDINDFRIDRSKK